MNENDIAVVKGRGRNSRMEYINVMSGLRAAFRGERCYFCRKTIGGEGYGHQILVDSGERHATHHLCLKRAKDRAVALLQQRERS
ncbi:hypothetical protein LCGC14_1618580 [marine sediment metagenome]|uniref:Uncharacterized protein n=1 Tax=marine sediment metagenome TaxID=412755 RepID=A0A0F9L651_9ZZZZ